jgi:hypothetical protein
MDYFQIEAESELSVPVQDSGGDWLKIGLPLLEKEISKELQCSLGLFPYTIG